MERHSLTLSPPELAADCLGFFRWGHIAGKVLVTTDAGDWAFLTDTEFNDLLAGRIGAGHARFDELRQKGLLRDGLDLDAFAARMAQRNRHMRYGPRVHVITVAVRRHPSRQSGQASDADMSIETAEKVVDLALQTTSPTVAFEIQGDGCDPLLNAAVIRHLVEYAQQRNQRSVGKSITFLLLSNLTAMTEEIAEWLIAHDVVVSTSLDGPARLHDANRKWKGGSAHADVVRWIEYFHRRYQEMGRDQQRWHVDGLLTVTRQSLAAWREVIDEYVARGLPSIHLRPLDPSRLSAALWQTIGYSEAEYFDFYRKALDYVLEVNRRGTDLRERMASIFLTKILTSDDPGVVDLQSPDGAGTNQLAYNVDGRVFPSDEARVVDAMGDSMFELGHVRNLSISQVLKHPTVRAIAAASLLDAQPQCAECWNKPFCGFSPVRNVLTQGDLFGQRPRCFECKEHMAVSTRVFDLLGDESNATSADMLKQWMAPGSRISLEGRASKEAP